MRVLALDTTTRAGSVAVVENGRVLSEHAGDPSRSHVERLPGELTRALDVCGWSSADVDLFAVVAGPGSFTGIRIGIASMQGLAFVHGRAVVGVSALEVLAQSVCADRPQGTRVGAWVDAHRQEVYGALYETTDAAPFRRARLIEMGAPAVERPEALLRAWSDRLPRVTLFAGDGAEMYRSDIEAAPAFRGSEIAAPRLLAGAAALVAAARAEEGEAAVESSGVRPIYIRRPDVVMARERELGAR